MENKKLMFKLDESKILPPDDKTQMEKIINQIDRAEKAMNAETRPCFKKFYDGKINGLKLALGLLIEAEEGATLRMDLLLDEGPF